MDKTLNFKFGTQLVKKDFEL